MSRFVGPPDRFMHPGMAGQPIHPAEQARLNHEAVMARMEEVRRLSQRPPEVVDPCDDCGKASRVWACSIEQCGQSLCDACDKWIHQNGSLKAHQRRLLRRLCAQCHIPATIMCGTCVLALCDECSKRMHAKAARKLHSFA